MSEDYIEYGASVEVPVMDFVDDKVPDKRVSTKVRDGSSYISRSTMPIEGGGTVYTGIIPTHEEGVIELSGFEVLVNGESSFDVIARYKSVKEAKKSIKGDKFIFKKNGETKVGLILSGSPVLSTPDIELCTYVEGDWK